MCFILGDFNINLATDNDNSTKYDFLNCLYSTSFFPTINVYTRESKTTNTIIDNVLTNIQNTRFDSGVMLSDISDHYPIVLFADLTSKYKVKSNKSSFKQKTKVLTNKFLLKLSELLGHKTWDCVYKSKTPDEAYNAFINEITDSINITIPEKTISKDANEQNKWLTKGILKSIRKKNKLYKQYITN